MPVGYYDPDGGGYENMMRKSLTAKTSLQEKALLACRRTSLRFKNVAERKAFKDLETHGLGATNDAIVYVAWMEHNIQLVVDANAKKLQRTMTTLIKMIGNNDRRADWEVHNRDKVLKERAVSIKKYMTQEEQSDEGIDYNFDS